MVQSNLFYDFGRWGHYTPDRKGKVMPGFLPSSPGTEIIGEYDVVFVAALDQSGVGGAKNVLRMTTQGRLTVKECFHLLPVSIRGDGISRKIRAKTMLSVKVEMPEWGHPTWKYFGPGYNCFGFPKDSQLSRCYQEKPTNASLVVTKKNNNLGRMYVVSERKAFCRIHKEAGLMTDEPVTTSKLQKQEAIKAEQCCCSRHFLFLCRDLRLPCNVCVLITRFVIDDPPFMFAEPGDIWIDISLSTSTTTYVLGRRRFKNFLGRPMTIHEIEQYSQSIKNEFMQTGDKEKIMVSMDRMKTTPDAALVFVQLCVKYSTGHRCKDNEREAIISILSILYKNKNLTSGDITGGFGCFFKDFGFYVRRESRAMEYMCNIITELLHLEAIDIKLLCEFLELPEDNLFSHSSKEHLIDMCVAFVISRYNIVEAKKHFIKASDTLVRSLGAGTWRKISVKYGLRS